MFHLAACGMIQAAHSKKRAGIAGYDRIHAKRTNQADSLVDDEDLSEATSSSSFVSTMRSQ